MARIEESLNHVDAALKRLEGSVTKATAKPASERPAEALDSRLVALAERVDTALASARAARAALDDDTLGNR